MEPISLSREEYRSLKNDALKLRALEIAGVVHWEKYVEAMDLLKNMQ